MGMPKNAYWVVGNYVLSTGQTGTIHIRKPEITKGNPVPGASFGYYNIDSLEWNLVLPGIDFGHIPTPERYLAAVSSLNTHFMIEPTFYKSTVNSSVYKVSDGFGPDQTILGVKTSTTVTGFLTYIHKEDEGQVFTIASGADNSELAKDALLSMNDKLIVKSADGKNTTVYRLDVSENGLSSDAVLTSTRWKITIDVSPKSAGETGSDGLGSVSGFDYGTNIKTIVDNIKVPAGASLTIVDETGSYVPFKTLNFDTAYVNVTVNSNIYLDVVAQDGLTRIIYQLKPSTSQNDAFILSDVYSVAQLNNLIQYVPRGTNFSAFLSNITASLGASLKLVDKMGFERTQGNIREDDKVVVTSANGLVKRVYFISFLPTATIPATTYLAYVQSVSYAVDQVNYVITGGSSDLTGSTMVPEFYSRIIPAAGATAVVVDANGNEKTTGDLNQGDVLKVTSADKKINVIYQLDLDITSAGKIGLEQIEIYPNPTSGVLNISGIQTGNRIQLYNATGALILDRTAAGNFEVLSLDKVPSGMFFIVISNENKMLGRFKAIKN
jgi:hypothetical protein